MLLWHSKKLCHAVGQAFGVHERFAPELRLPDEEGEHIDKVEVKCNFLICEVAHCKVYIVSFLKSNVYSPVDLEFGLLDGLFSSALRGWKSFLQDSSNIV